MTPRRPPMGFRHATLAEDVRAVLWLIALIGIVVAICAVDPTQAAR